MTKTLYTAVASSTGDGRAGGHVATDDGLIDLDLAVPRELGGPGGATNPEQLFAAGWATCFHSALKVVAAREKLTIPGSVVTAEVSLQKGEEGGYALSATLNVVLTGTDQEVAARLVESAHATCPFSAATRGNMPVTLALTVR